MNPTTMALRNRAAVHVPGSLIRALLHSQPEALEAALDEAGLEASDLAAWARQAGAGREVEKLAGWLSVGHQPDDYAALIDVAAGHLRAGELLEAVPVFRWAYQVWRAASVAGPAHRYDGTKLLALWGECLYRLGQPADARERWQWALALVPDGETLSRLARTVARAGAMVQYEELVAEACRRSLPGAGALPALATSSRSWRHSPSSTGQMGSDIGDGPKAALPLPVPVEPEAGPQPLLPRPQPPATGGAHGKSVAVMADVANLDMVCRDQYGPGWRLDYGRLLRAAAQHGPLGTRIAFVPDLYETRAVRQHLAEVGFDLDLKRPKRWHGRIVANADTAMAASAVRWAGSGQVGRLELWTGDGDFCKVREVIGQAWPEVTVAFRSFEAGTSGDIRRLGEDWSAIGPEYLQA